ncbi:MAG: hypothetical protein QM817_15090 [Archangium sp.]
MISLALALTLVTGGVDKLTTVSLGGLKFKGPAEWQKTEPDENSIQWDEPDSGAVMAVSVFPVDPARPAKACVGQMVDALGKDGFAATTIGTQPASKKSVTDQLADPNAQPLPDGGEPEKTGDKVTTTTIVGCNGKVKWLLTWTAKTSEGARFGPILKRVMESISYGGK